VSARAPWILLAFLALAVAGSATADAEEELAPGDFAHGREVELRTPGPLQLLLLDLPIYRGTVEPRLADLRVFNAAGEAVPHALRSLAQPQTRLDEFAELPLFRLPDIDEGEPSVSSMNIGNNIDNNIDNNSDERIYSIDAEISDNGAVVRIRSKQLPPDEGEDAQASATPEAAVPAGYLIDASQLERAVVDLEFELAGGPVEFVVPLRIEGSGDLVHFQSLGTRAALVRLDQSGHRIEISRVDLPASRHRYLRLTWPEAKLPVGIRAVRARLAPETEPPPRDGARIPGQPMPDEANAFLFDLGGEVPVDRVQLALPQTNTLVEVQLFSGPTDGGPWSRHHSGLLYALEHTATLRNPDVRWPVTRHRYFKLVVAPKGGGLGAGTPVLEISWYPEQLLFITRGEPPFRLGYGRAQVRSTRFAAADLIATTHTRSRELPRETAVLGAEYPVAKRSVLEPPEEPTSMRTVALWGVLVLSVCVVLAMSLRLLRQMRSR